MATSNGAGRFGLYLAIGLSAAGLVATMIGAFYTLATMAYQLNATVVKTEAMSTLLRQDEDIIRVLQLKLNSVEVSLNEVETQFCADDQMRNVMHATDMRIQSMLWQRAYPESKLPTDNAYYPTICNRKAN